MPRAPQKELCRLYVREDAPVARRSEIFDDRSRDLLIQFSWIIETRSTYLFWSATFARAVEAR